MDEAAVYRAVKHSLSSLFSHQHFQQPAALTAAPQYHTKPPTHAFATAPHAAHTPTEPATPDTHPEPSPAAPLSDLRIHPTEQPQPAPLPTEPPSPPGEQLGFSPPKPQHPHYLQVFGTYIILQVDQSVWILDQHAVHERILYERIRANHTAESQPYLSPKVMTLDPDQLQRYTDHQDTLRQLGFDTDIFGPEQIIIRGVPALFMDTNSTAILSDLLNQLEPTADSTTIHSWQQRACKSAIKAGKRLLPADVDALITEFLEAPNNFTCPHGRPLFVQYDVADFEQWFKRR